MKDCWKSPFTRAIEEISIMKETGIQKNKGLKKMEDEKKKISRHT
jgi:hypothetical protein